VFFDGIGSSAVQEWVAANKAVTTVIPTGLTSPTGLVVDAVGNLYVADAAANTVSELPRAFVDPTAKSEGRSAGHDTLPTVLPASENLKSPFAPTSDQSWLTIKGITNGVLSFTFSANTGLPRTATITLLRQPITVSQDGINPIQFTATTISTNGTFQFSFTNVTGATFTVLSSTDVSLPLNQWTPVGSSVEGPPGQYQFTGASTTNSQVFYIISSP
jgi:hypothetical protein